jgi:hypothetical protein
MMDMESAGFFKVARMFVDHDRIHAVKVISDNNDEQMRAINAKQVEALVESQLNGIDAIVQQILGVQKSLATVVVKEEPFYARWHFTVSERSLLRESLRRWQVLNPSADPYKVCSSLTCASQVLRRLADMPSLHWIDQ